MLGLVGALVAYNSRGLFSIDCSVFGSLVEDVNPTTLPIGISPDNQNMFYLPGGAFTRPAITVITPEPISDVEILSGSDFVMPSGEVRTITLDADGNLRANDPTDPSSTQLLEKFSEGTRFKSTVYDGKQWYALFNVPEALAFSENPFAGTEAPHYFNGENIYRVTSDAPGVSPGFVNLATAPMTLTPSNPVQFATISAAQSGGEGSYTQGQRGLFGGFTSVEVDYWTTLTFTTNVPCSSSLIGANVSITSMNEDALNISGEIIAVSGDTFTIAWYSATYYSTTGETGSASILGSYFIRQGNIVTAFTGAVQPAQLVPGLWVSIQNGDGTLINGPSWAITAISQNVDGLVTVTIDQQLTNLPSGAVLFVSPNASQYVGNVSVTNGNSVVTWVSGDKFDVSWVGSAIIIDSISYSVLSVPSATSLSLSSPITSLSGTYGYSSQIILFPAGFQTVYQVLGTTTAGGGSTFDFSVVQTAQAVFTSHDGSASFPGNVTVGNTILVAVAQQAAGVPTVTDNLGNTYNPVVSYHNFGGYGLQVFYAEVTTGGSCTVAVAASHAEQQILIGQELFGLVTPTPLDGSAINVGTGTSFVTQNITTADAPDAVFSIAFAHSTLTPGAGSGLTLSATASVSGGGNAQSLAFGYTVSPVAGTFGGSWTQLNNAFWIGATIGFSISTSVAATGTTTFTYQSLNPLVISSTTGIISSASGGSVYQQWSPTFGQFGNAAQVLEVENGSLGGWQFQFFQLGPDIALYTPGGNPQAAIQAQISPGFHNFVCMFQSEDGAITAPSVPVTVSVTGGSALLFADNIPIGPPGTTQRIIGSTPANTDNYFYLGPATVPATGFSGPQITLGTIINDNTTTSAVIDFSDIALISGIAIDVTGNDLFNQIVLPPSLGVIAYQERLAWWGSVNMLQNFLNLGFDGGYLPDGDALGQPLGWTISGDGEGQLAQVDGHSGFVYQMAGGFNNQIQQPAYQDFYGEAIVSPSTAYYFRFNGLVVGPTTGNFIADFFSPSLGQIAKATFPISSFPTTGFDWLVQPFNVFLPTPIPPDLVLRIYLSGATGYGTKVYIDELEVIPQDQPVTYTQAWVSYAFNPFGYDGVSGVYASDVGEPFTAMFEQRSFLYVLTDSTLLQGKSTGNTEPDGWDLERYSDFCGCSGPNAVATNESIAVWAGRYGGRLFSGSPDPRKVTQELARTWESINWKYETTIWVANDPVQQMILFGIPTDGATMPSTVLCLNHRLNDDVYNVPDPVHISAYSGKMIATDLGRKWSPWDLALNCGWMGTRDLGSGLEKILLVGGNHGNAYYFDFQHYWPVTQVPVWKCVDDDYGSMDSWYTTAFFYPHDVEQQPQLDHYRKLFGYLAVHASGIGTLQVTPILDAITGEQPSLPQPVLTVNDPLFDYEFAVNVTGNRCAFRIAPQPQEGYETAALALTHMIVGGRKDLVFPNRGSVFTI